MRYNHIVAIAAIFFTIALVGCSSNSPKAVADKFLTSFYHMEYDKAREVSTEEAKELVNLMEQFALQQPDSVKQNAKKINVDIIDVKEEGDKATVTYSVSTEPGEQTLKLVKQNGQWLVSHSKQDDVDDSMSDEQLLEEATTIEE